MRGVQRACLASVLLFAALCKPQNANLWLNPPGPDFATTVTIGDTFVVMWKPELAQAIATNSPNTDVDNVDLWVTDYNLRLFAHRIASSQNLSVSTSFMWTVEISNNELFATHQWLFRFLAHGVDYSVDADQVWSPSVLVQSRFIAAGTTSSNTPVPATTALSSSTAMTTTVDSSPSTAATSTAAPVNGSSRGEGGLSTGAKVGIAVGAIAGAVLLLGLGWCLAKRCSGPQKNDTAAPPTYAPVPRASVPVAEVKPSLSGNEPAELGPQHPQPNRAELARNGTQMLSEFELQGPAPHELRG